MRPPPQRVYHVAHNVRAACGFALSQACKMIVTYVKCSAMMQRLVGNGVAAILVGTAVVVLVVCGVIGTSDYLWAQDTTQETNVPKQNGGTQWALNCTEQQAGVPDDCQVSQIMTLRETGQRILMVVVKKDTRSREPHVMLALPHKIYLPAGVIVQVDTQVPREMDIETCDERACYATGMVSTTFQKYMQGGQAMHVTFQNLLRKPVTVSVPLRGFTEAYAQLN